MLAALAAAAAVVAFPALSGATTTTDPVVATEAATSVTSTSATLNGTVTLNDDADGTYTFRWGMSSGVYTDSTGGTVPAGASDQAVPSTITGLQPGTTYFYELCATNSDNNEVCDGADEQSFTTTPAAPDATTGSGSASTTSTSATLNGTVNPNGDSTTYLFYYSTSSSVACDNSSDSSTGGPAGSGTTPTPVSDTISGLAANTTYYFRLFASNSYGTTCSQTASSFTTPNAPSPTTGGASPVTASTETVNGTIVPNGATITSAVFKYCTGCSSALSGASVSASLSGTNPVSATANLAGLASGTTFRYTLCASNAYGTNCGADGTFKTDTPPTAALTATTPTTGPTPLTVTFDGSGSSDPDPGDAVASYTFSFGDGSSPKKQSTPAVTHTYSNPCSPCTASLTVTDEEGATSSPATVVIHANADQPPVASLTATPTPTSGTVPLAVTFDGSGSSDPDGSIASWSLDFGDGSGTGTKNAPVSNTISHTYTAPGTYEAILTVTDNSGESTESAPVTVNVNPPPTISIGDVSHNEGNSGTTNFDFPVTLSAVSTHDVTVDYATADGTATAGSDYTATNGTLTIPAGTDCTNPAGKPACQIPVPVTGDTIYENNETFTLNLANPTGATIADGTATGTIVNDDQPPLLEAESGATLEGNTGSVVSGAQSWSAGGSLQLNDASGFPNSEGTHTFYISTPGSPSVGGPYTYNGLSGNMLTGVSPAGSVAVGQIAFQARFVTVPVVLCDPQKTPDNNPADCVPTHSGLDTKVHYATSDGHSLTTSIPVIEGQDYVSAAGTLTIPAGQPSGSVTFQTIPNTTPENPTDPADDLTRWFNVLFSSPTNATIEPGDSLGIATIIEDDGLNPPTATTGAASSIGADHATVAATVNPNGDATDVFVQYGPTDSYGSQTATQHLAAGNSAQALTFSLTGLSPGTKYHYQVVATHSDHSAGYGQDEIFTTDVPPTAVLKADKTSGPVPLTVTFDGAGSSDPDGSIASWSLDFGDGSSRGGTGAVPSAIAHTYASSCACKASLTVTDNQGGRSTPATVSINVGPTKTKKGLPPKFSTYNTTVGPTSAKIVFPVDPNGAETRVWVEYGTSPSYGEMSSVQTIPAGSTQTLTFTLTGLSPATVYHYALFAAHTTDSGAAHSQDLTFRTQKLKSMSVTLKVRSMRATTRGTVSLSVYCGGNALGLCKGRALLRLGHLAAGSVSFSVARAHRKRVSLKLKKTVLKRLLAGSSLRLGLDLSVQTGTNGVALTTLQIKVLPPRK